jgi:hypothetical protein
MNRHRIKTYVENHTVLYRNQLHIEPICPCMWDAYRSGTKPIQDLCKVYT